MSSRDVASRSNEEKLSAHEGFEFEMHVRVRKNGRCSATLFEMGNRGNNACGSRAG